MASPPNKKRRTGATTQEEEMWEDDDELTEADIEVCDDYIAASQQAPVPSVSTSYGGVRTVAPPPSFQPTDENRNPSRFVGRGACKSRSASDVNWGRRAQEQRLGAVASKGDSGALYGSKAQLNHDGRSLSYGGRTTTPVVNVTGNHGRLKGSGSSAPLTASTGIQQTNGKLQAAGTGKLQAAGTGKLQAAGTGKLQTASAGRPQTAGSTKDARRTQEDQEAKFKRDGEIQMLRDKLAAAEKELNQSRQEKVQMMNEQAQQQSDKEKRLESENDRLQTLLQFKEQDIGEAKAQLKKIGAASPSQVSVSPVKTTTPSKAPGASKGSFPTRASFVERSPHSKASSVRPEKATQIHRDSPITVTSADIPQPSLRLPVGRHLGTIHGASLVSDLLGVGGHAVQRYTLDRTGLANVVAISDQIAGFSLAGGLQRSDSSGPSSSSSGSSSMNSTSTTSSGSGSSGSGGGTMDELQALAVHGIHELLQSTPVSVELGDVSPAQLLSSNTQAAVFLLPAIESYLDSVSLPVNSSDSSYSSRSSGSTPSGPSSLDCSSLESSDVSATKDDKGFSVQRTMSILQALLCLVTNSSLVRVALFTGKIPTQSEPNDSTSQNSGPSSSTLSFKGTKPSGPNIAEAHLLPEECHILNMLTKFANPLCLQGRRHGPRVCLLSLQILSRTLASCSPSELEKVDLSLNECLGKCLKDSSDIADDVKLTIILASMDVLIALVPSPKMFSSQCPHAEHSDCALAKLYHLCSEPITLNSHKKTRVLFPKLVSLLSAVMASYKTASIVTEANCNCSVDLVKALVLLMHREYESYVEEPEARQLAVLRSGITLLYALSRKDRLFAHHWSDVDHEFTELLSGMDRVCRHLGADGDVSMIQELWEHEDPMEQPRGGGDGEGAAHGPSTPTRVEENMEVITID